MAGAGQRNGDDEAAVDRLYALDPGEFVAARDALARELRQAGRREQATEVHRLRRPTLAAWAVDQLAHRQPERVEELMAAGERLRQAQEEVLGGGDRAALRRASEGRRELIARLANDAVQLLRERGSEIPDAHRDDIEATLAAAALDPDLAELLRRGRLAGAAPRPAGFGGLLDLSPAPGGGGAVPAPGLEEPTGAPGDDEQVERDREEAARLEQRAVEAEVEADRARARAEEADAEVARLRDELERARSRATAATEEAREAAVAAEAARREAGGHQGDHRPAPDR